MISYFFAKAHDEAHDQAHVTGEVKFTSQVIIPTGTKSAPSHAPPPS